MGIIEGNQPVSDNDWESVKKGGDAAIAKWIATQMIGRTCTVVLVGANTAGRKWINHEIVESWNKGMGVVGIRIHRLLDSSGNGSSIGGNPFDSIEYGTAKLSSVVKLYDPSYTASTDVYNYIKRNLAGWVEEAITIRSSH
jgi:hypothetical protein